MALKNLTPDVRGFLYTLFNASAQTFSSASTPISSGLSKAVKAPQGSLAAAFQRARYMARNGTAQDLNNAIDDLLEKINAETNPDTKEELENARLKQQLLYRGRVKNNPSLKSDLGSFSAGVF